MNAKPHDQAKLTRNQELVLAALNRQANPLSAYGILDLLRGQGLRAPLQVYRALDKLVEMGLAHKLESLNAFVACSHPECDDLETTVFTICGSCQRVSELNDPKLAKALKKLAAGTDFQLRKSIVELRGLCAACGSP